MGDTIKACLAASDIADYFLASVDADSGDNLSNLKLQKLLYYAQGFHVATHGKEVLFDEQVLAWDHGPVVEPVDHRFKGYGWQGIDRPSVFCLDAYTPEVRELLNAVYAVYGQYSAKRLENMTHVEPPWSHTPRNGVISIDSLYEFFSRLVEAGRSDQSIANEPVWPTQSFRFQRRATISRRMAIHRERLGTTAHKVSADVDPWADDHD